MYINLSLFLFIPAVISASLRTASEIQNIRFIALMSKNTYKFLNTDRLVNLLVACFDLRKNPAKLETLYKQCRLQSTTI